MSQKKKQHYIPQFYLRNFSDNKKTFSVFHVANRTILPSVPCSSQCCETFFYGSDLEWENKLGIYESSWGAIIHKIINGQVCTEQEFEQLKLFALYQKQRTFAETKYRKEERYALVKEYMRIYLTKEGIMFNSEAEKECEKYVDEKYFFPGECLRLAQEIEYVVSDLKTLIIEYNTKLNLISSDVPIIIVNPFYPVSVGLGTIGIIIFYPISPNKLVVHYDSKMYPKYKNTTSIQCTDENEVKKLNIYQLLSADRVLFSNSQEEVFSFSEEEWNIRKNNRERAPLSMLGDETHRLIQVSTRKTIHDCSFSFGQVSHKFKRIPFVCKDCIPRVWSLEWERKLNLAESIMPKIIKDGKNDLGQSISKKDLRRGYRRMASAAKVYWTMPG